MSLKNCPVSEICIHYDSGSNRPPNHDVRLKHLCRKYIKGCELAVFVETQVMGLTIACAIIKRK